MSKELIVAGAFVVACLGVTVLALKKPSKPDPAPGSELAQNDPQPLSIYPVAANPPSSLTPIDSFGRDNLQGPAGTADLNPNRPFDNLGGAGLTGPGVIPFSGGSSLPGATSQPATSQPGSALPSTSSPISVIPTEAAPATSAGEQVHVVAKGDTLTEISKRYYGTTKHWRKIKDANQVDPNGLSEGTKLVIPVLAVSESTTATPTAVTGDGGVYVVKKNDTYYKIAKAQLGDASRAKEIEKLNQIPAADLRPGMKLALPARGARDTGAADAVAPAAGDRVHTVGKDEYLTDISKKWYGSTKHWRTIEKANPGIDPDRLKVGQKLVIPQIAGAATNGASIAAQPVAGEGEYVVIAGDTFEVIAGKVLGDKKQHKKIAEANPGVDSSRLRIGQKLKLPAGARGPADVPPSPTLPSADPLPLAPLPSESPLTPIPAPTLPAPDSGSPTAPAVDPWNLAPSGGVPGPSTTPANPWSDVGGPAGSTPSR